jgi:hypothetical protein
VTHTTLWAIWRHNNNRPQAVHGMDQVTDSRRGNAIVVGNQNQG